MPLCFVWEDYPDICPEGFKITKSAVKVDKNSGFPAYTVDTHVFAQNKDTILCITPGQLICPKDRLSSGERMARIQKKAPELFKPFLYNGQFCGVLYGKRGEIKSKLGINFF